MKLPPRSRRGVALVITLAFVVLLTIVVVSLTTSMRLDRTASGLQLGRASAAQYAQAGVEQAVATLRQNTGDPTKFWISQPGQLQVQAGVGATPSPSPTPVALSSGISSLSSSSQPAYLRPPDLNLPTLSDPTNYLIANPATSGTATQMQVKWRYVRQNPSVGANPGDPSDSSSETPVTTSTTNPIVGRYAYWADDESSKINLNLAWGRNTSPVNTMYGTTTTQPFHGSSPTLIDLTALANMTPMLASSLHNYITTDGAYAALNKGFFNTVQDARQVDGISSILSANKFDVTHYNHDPNTSLFNEDRIVLTTQPERAGWTYNTNSSYPNQWVGVNGLPSDNSKPAGQAGIPRFLDLGVYNNSTSSNAAANGSIIPAGQTIYSMLAYPGSLTGTSWKGFVTPVTGVPATAATLDKTVNMLMSYLARTDWPMAPGSSFKQKYPGVAPADTAAGIAQIALNIIDYVRSKECTARIVAPTGGVCMSGAYLSIEPAPNMTNNVYRLLGVSRTLLITEMADWVTGTSPYFTGTFYGVGPYDQYASTLEVEVYSPKYYNIASFNTSQLDFQINGSLTPNGDASLPYTYTVLADGETLQVVGNPLTPGGYAVLKWAGSTFVKPGLPPWGQKLAINIILDMDDPVSGGNTGLGLTGTSGILISRTPVVDDSQPANDGTSGNKVTTWPEFTIDAKGTSESGLTSLQVNDPRINRNKADWAQGAGTLGRINNNYNAGTGKFQIPPIPVPQVDTDSSGSVSDASHYMPPPSGLVGIYPDNTPCDNTAGVVTSVGELGFICTGTLNATPGTNWRSLRLQPSKQDSTVVPDWALLDIFTVPQVLPNAPLVKNDTTKSSPGLAVFAPHNTPINTSVTTSIGGRINLNAAAVVPFSTNPTPLSHTSPLVAALTGAAYNTGSAPGTVSLTQAQTLAANIAAYTTALASGTLSAGKLYNYPQGYVSIGELAEIKGIADKGESSETLLRDVAGLFTTRSSVFTIYSVGQAIKQSSSGTLTVTSEQRAQSMVERYLSTDPNSTSTPPAVVTSFSPVYYRNLTP